MEKNPYTQQKWEPPRVKYEPPTTKGWPFALLGFLIGCGVILMVILVGVEMML